MYYSKLRCVTLKGALGVPLKQWVLRYGNEATRGPGSESSGLVYFSYLPPMSLSPG